MKKKCKVVMLPTDKKANLLLGLSKQGILVYYSDADITNDKYNQKQHLYILSDDEIESDDWVLVYVDDKYYVHKTSYKDAIGWCMVGDFKFDQTATFHKIIATTDKSLGRYWKLDETIPLPQPSSSFVKKYVEEYNKERQIIDILVEYEEY